jgi:hypothetical protein
MLNLGIVTKFTIFNKDFFPSLFFFYKSQNIKFYKYFLLSFTCLLKTQ